MVKYVQFAAYLCLVIASVYVSFVLRSKGLPSSGLFYDDGWEAVPMLGGNWSQIFWTSFNHIGFTALGKLASEVFHLNALELFVLPILAGVLGTIAAYFAVQSITKSKLLGLIIALVLTISPMHIVYSGHLKSYVFDVLFGFLAIYVGAKFAKLEWNIAHSFLWLIISLFLATFSIHLFVVAAMLGFSQVWVRAQRWNWIMLGTIALQGAAQLGLLLHLSKVYNQAALSAAWVKLDGYPNFEGGILDLFLQIIMRVINSSSIGFGEDSIGILVLILSFAGLLLAKRTEKYVCYLSASIIGAAIVGNILNVFPFGLEKQSGRVDIWAQPYWLLLSAVGLKQLYLHIWQSSVRILKLNEKLRFCFDETHRQIMILIGCLAVVLFSTVFLLWAHERPVIKYTPSSTGSLQASLDAAKLTKEGDILLLLNGSLYQFSAQAGLKYQLKHNAKLMTGFSPEIIKKNIKPVKSSDLRTQTFENTICAETCPSTVRILEFHKWISRDVIKEMYKTLNQLGYMKTDRKDYGPHAYLETWVRV